MRVYTMDEIDNIILGPKGTAERDSFDKELEEERIKVASKYTCPGDYIRQGVKQKKIKLKEFAQMMNITPSNLTELLQSKRRITPLIAQRLEDNLDYPQDYWLKLQDDYDLEKKRKRKDSVIVDKSLMEQVLQELKRFNEQISILVALQKDNHSNIATIR